LVGIGGVLILLGGILGVAATQLGTGGGSDRTLIGNTGSSLVKVDLNRATVGELVTLPGITADVADRIIRHRPYRKLDDLVTRRILGKKEFARIREQIIVGRSEE
jgi:radical SAM superfamily enzyme with C-terminal helix-hairpin-helix motif